MVKKKRHKPEEHSLIPTLLLKPTQSQHCMKALMQQTPKRRDSDPCPFNHVLFPQDVKEPSTKTTKKTKHNNTKTKCFVFPLNKTTRFLSSLITEPHRKHNEHPQKCGVNALLLPHHSSSSSSSTMKRKCMKTQLLFSLEKVRIFIKKCLHKKKK